MSDEKPPTIESIRIESIRKDLYVRLRQQTEHEDNLINHRLTWFLSVQGFLFVIFSALLATEKQVSHKAVILFFIALLGCLVSIAIFLNIVLAYRSLDKLQQSWLYFNVEHKLCTKESELLKDGYPQLKESELLKDGYPQLRYHTSRKWYATLFGATESLNLFIVVTWALLICVALYDPLHGLFVGWFVNLILILLMGVALFIVRLLLAHLRGNKSKYSSAHINEDSHTAT